ncbi:hypothetical protein ACWIWK_00155 [Helicobacter sp. 23-1048]
MNASESVVENLLSVENMIKKAIYTIYSTKLGQTTRIKGRAMKINFM